MRPRAPSRVFSLFKPITRVSLQIEPLSSSVSSDKGTQRLRGTGFPPRRLQAAWIRTAPCLTFEDPLESAAAGFHGTHPAGPPGGAPSAFARRLCCTTWARAFKGMEIVPIGRSDKCHIVLRPTLCSFQQAPTSKPNMAKAI